jgi:hypothetical protein
MYSLEMDIEGDFTASLGAGGVSQAKTGGNFAHPWS